MTQDQHSIEGLMALISEYGHCRWSEGSSSATHLDHMGEQRSREEAADLYKQIESYAAHLQQRPLPVSGEGVLVLLKRPEGYEDVHPELLLQDANINPAFEPEIVSRPLPVREGTRERIMHLMLSFGSQCHAAAKDPTDDYPRRMAENALARLEELLASPSLPVREESTDEHLESLIENSDGHWKEDVFCIGGPELMALLRAASSPSVQNSTNGVDVPLKGGA